jgi:hypothetical protein
VHESQKLKTDITPILTAIMTGHEKKKLISIGSNFWNMQTALAATEIKP